MYNLSSIMLKAWSLYRTKGIDFSEALHRAWLCAKAVPVNADADRVRLAKERACISEEVNTWSAWKAKGYEVIHGSKALFGCERPSGGVRNQNPRCRQPLKERGEFILSFFHATKSTR